MKRTLKKLLPLFAINLLKYCLHEKRLLFNKRRIVSLCRNDGEICLEIGSGSKKGKGIWKTLDLALGCDFYWDLALGLPFSDNRVSMIYSSHVFEHFTHTEATALLAECHRVLISNGIFSICVPNARPYLESYVGGSPLQESFYSYRAALHGTTGMDYVNYMAYMNGTHKNMFDENSLLSMLARAGFRNVRLRAFDPSLDMAERDYQSIYAHAVK